MHAIPPLLWTRLWLSPQGLAEAPYTPICSKMFSNCRPLQTKPFSPHWTILNSHSTDLSHSSWPQGHPLPCLCASTYRPTSLQDPRVSCHDPLCLPQLEAQRLALKKCCWSEEMLFKWVNDIPHEHPSTWISTCVQTCRRSSSQSKPFSSTAWIPHISVPVAQPLTLLKVLWLTLTGPCTRASIQPSALWPQVQALFPRRSPWLGDNSSISWASTMYHS